LEENEQKQLSPDDAWRPTFAWFGPLVAWRIGLLLLALGSITLLPNIFSVENWAANPHWPQTEAPDFSTHWKTWDSQHYLRIAEAGYEPGTKTSAFYPLWPLVIRAAAPLYAGNHLLAALVMANLLAVLAGLLLHRVIRERLEERIAGLSLLLCLAFPGAFFLGLPYSESLFLLLIALFFFGLQTSRVPLAGVAAFLLPLCRPTGLLILAPFAVHCFIAWRKEGKGPAQLLWALTPLAGFAAYLGLMAGMAGDPLEGFAAQDLFHTRSTIWRLFDIPAFVMFFIQGAERIHGVTNSLLDRLWFIWLLVCLPAIWRLDKTWFAFAVVMGVIPCMTAPVVSFTRYALVLFPVFAVTARTLESPRGRPWALPVLVGFGSFQALLMILHINNMWAG